MVGHHYLVLGFFNLYVMEFIVKDENGYDVYIEFVDGSIIFRTDQPSFSLNIQEVITSLSTLKKLTDGINNQD